ncbi:hypothetical protein FCM35_KLT00844 [Carex littledalei]|uniref:Uncharacterized protein n=1 Tax=Carex littledalei TaxID=544730 RepID=A0A833R4E5_9POAL|nr:hypothetical protein FCM35_KLT00844 [Carex littledalei]
MLRTAAIASLGLRRLLVPSTTAVAPGSRPPLLRFISGPSTSRFLPTLDLTRGYARGRQSSSSCDSESDINDEYDEEMDSGDEGDDDLLDSDFEDHGCDYGSENDFDHDRE